MKYYFKPLAMEDLGPLHHWFQEPVIKQLYTRNQMGSLNDTLCKYQPRIAG